MATSSSSRPTKFDGALDPSALEMATAASTGVPRCGYPGPGQCRHQCRPGRDADLAVDRAEVALHGPDAEVQLVGDFLRRAAGRRDPGHVPLARRQPLDAQGASDAGVRPEREGSPRSVDEETNCTPVENARRTAIASRVSTGPTWAVTRDRGPSDSPSPSARRRSSVLHCADGPPAEFEATHQHPTTAPAPWPAGCDAGHRTGLRRPREERRGADRGRTCGGRAALGQSPKPVSGIRVPTRLLGCESGARGRQPRVCIDLSPAFCPVRPSRRSSSVTLISDADPTVPVTVQARSRLSPAACFDIIVPIDLSLVFGGWGPSPACVGSTSRPAHGTTSAYRATPTCPTEPPRTRRYRIQPTAQLRLWLTGFTNALALLVDGVRGEWTFTPDGSGSLIRWTYEFKPRKFRHLVVRSGLAPLWRRYMQAGLAASVAACERGTRWC